MILYNILLFITGGLSFVKLKKKSTRTAMRLIIFPMIVIVGLRSIEIGNDTITYLRTFSNLKYFSILEVISGNFRIEKGYLIYNKIIQNIYPEYWFFLFITSLAIFYAIHLHIKKNSYNTFLSVFLLISFGYYGQTMNITRQMIAISLILIAYEKLKVKRNISFVLMIILASFFHKTAIIFMSIYFLREKKYSHRNFKAFMLASIIINLIGMVLIRTIVRLPFFSRFAGYIGGNYIGQMNIGSLFGIIISLSSICSLYYTYAIKCNTKKLKSETSIEMWICSFGFLFSSLTLTGSIMSRIALYFMFFNITFITKVLKFSRNKRIWTVIVLVLAFTYFSIIMLLRPEWNYIYPYRFFWQ